MNEKNFLKYWDSSNPFDSDIDIQQKFAAMHEETKRREENAKKYW